MPNERRRSRTGWLWSAAAVLAVVGAALGLAQSRPPMCEVGVTPNEPSAPSRVPVLASTFVPRTLPSSSTATGEARYYTLGRRVACSFSGLASDGFYAALSTADYGRADLCGATLELQGPRGTVRAVVVDRCPGCTTGQLVLNEAAFGAVAEPRTGVAEVRYRVVRDPQPMPELTYQVKPDSSSGFGILFDGTGNALAEVAIRPVVGDPWRELTRGMDNYWRLSDAGSGPFGARLTDVYGNRVEISGLTVGPGQRSTDARLYTGAPSFTATAVTSLAPQAAQSDLTPLGCAP
ncbi:expansin EXLX1 family cellulose-binding protein [Nocardia sp. NPDC049190]|uniref:expansin EXLX1 family cellulose-binding protein n=1 Tax=Nocardia sp. NPDC049190 TaxID=3155650 RepID=UPI0033EB9942